MLFLEWLKLISCYNYEMGTTPILSSRSKNEYFSYFETETRSGK